jgi:hypothetical protein
MGNTKRMMIIRVAASGNECSPCRYDLMGIFGTAPGVSDLSPPPPYALKHLGISHYR